MEQPDVYEPEIQRGRRYRSSDVETMDTETGFVGSRDGKNRNGEYRNGKRAEDIVLFRRGKESDTVSTA